MSVNRAGEFRRQLARRVLLVLGAILVTPSTDALAAITIEGRVVEDHSGAPVATAEVRVSRVGVRGQIADLETDREGRFSVPDLLAAEYQIEIAKQNHVPARMRLNAGSAPPAVLLVRLVRLAAVEGRVIDSEGRPVPRAQVMRIEAAGSADAYGPPSFRATTDVDGRYRLYGLSPGKFLLAVYYATGLTNATMTVLAYLSNSAVLFYPNNSDPRFFDVAGGEDYSNIDFVLAPGLPSAISGKLELPTPGEFQVALVPADRPVVAVGTRQAKPDGAFQFEGVAPGSYDLLASGPGIVGFYTPSTVPPETEPSFGRTRVVVTGQDVTGVSVAVHQGESTTFLLRSVAQQQGVGGCPDTAELTLTPGAGWPTSMQRSVRLSLGKQQTVSSLAPGRYRLAVAGLGPTCFSVEDTVIDLSARENSGPVVVDLLPAGSIRGRLRAGSSVSSEFAVTLLDTDPSDGLRPIETTCPDAEGKFEFTGLRPGRFRVAVQPGVAGTGKRWVRDPASQKEVEVVGGAYTNVELEAVLPPNSDNTP